METINDIGASEYLRRALELTSPSIPPGSAAAASRALHKSPSSCSCWSSRAHRHGAVGPPPPARPCRPRHASEGPTGAHPHVAGARGTLLCLGVSLPVVLGFGIPLLVYGRYALRRIDQAADPALLNALFHSLTTATFTAILTVAAALCCSMPGASSWARRVGVLVRLAASGYALPGTILGLGLLFALGRADAAIDAGMRAPFRLRNRFFLTGSAAAVIIACPIRFLALAEGALRSGLQKLPPHLDEAARSLGSTANGSAWQSCCRSCTPHS